MDLTFCRFFTGARATVLSLLACALVGLGAAGAARSQSGTADAAPRLGGPEAGSSALVLTGVIDGPLTGGLPKAVEIYVRADVADLSVYGLGTANNGGGSDGSEFTFPTDAATAGTFLYVATESPEFTAWFGFPPTYIDGNATDFNGDDAVELFMNGSVVDVFGDINMDGTGESWEYLDGWAYRADGTGPDGSTFVLASWTFSGPNALDGETSNATAETPFPTASYDPTRDCPSGIVLSDFDTTDGAEFFEITNASGGALDLTNCTALSYNVFTGNAALTFDLDGVALDDMETYRIGNAGVPDVDREAPVGFLPEPWGFGFVKGDLAPGETAFDLRNRIVTSVIYLEEDAVYLFYHSDLALDALYCGFYGDRLAPNSPEVCPPLRVAGRADGWASFASLLAALRASLGDPSADAVVSASSLPSAYALHGARPNPSRSSATVGYDLPEAATVRLAVYDVLGREVAVLVDGVVEAGAHTAPFDASRLPSGTYLVRLDAGAFVQTHRLTVVR